MAEPNCLPICSCCTRSPPHSKPFRRCGGCKVRTYCERKCQVLDWKFCNHKSFCKKSGDEHVNSNTHQPRCAYLDRDPEIEDTCMVETGRVKTNPRELITTGMNTCIFVVIKTKTQMIGWHTLRYLSVETSADLVPIGSEGGLCEWFYCSRRRQDWRYPKSLAHLSDHAFIPT